MRYQQRLRFGMLFTASLWMVGCQTTTLSAESDTGQTAPQQQQQDVQQFQIEVAPVLEDCVGVAPMKCMQYRKKGDRTWLNHYGEIEGFEYQPDYRYVLEIKQTSVLNPPADASSLRWELVRIVEKQPVTK
ncbi:MAG: DUF4377 domain-containing protein [Pseudomonadota bacterium]|nr:DUF4377 domain-containing protein [Pseudomonadota bacterium]